MQARRDLWVGIFVVVAASLTLSFVSIGVFVRMAPAIESIVRKNVPSLEASRAMMAVFADRLGEGIGERGVERLEAALATLAQTATDEADRELHARLLDTMGRALGGEREPVRQFLGAVAASAELDYHDMRAADDEARRLGSAGAWAAALAGLVVVLLGVAAFVRLDRRVARPAAELSRVLEAARSGDRRRRCRPLEGAAELERALGAVNSLLDRVAEGGREAAQAAAAQHDARARAALVGLLEQLGAALVWGAGPGGGAGEVVAASAAALERLASDAALRGRVEAAVAAGAGEGITCAPLGEGLTLCRFGERA